MSTTSKRLLKLLWLLPLLLTHYLAVEFGRIQGASSNRERLDRALVTAVLKLAQSGNLDAAEKSGLVQPSAIKELKDLESKRGKIRSFQLKETSAVPAKSDTEVLVERTGGQSRESFLVFLDDGIENVLDLNSE